MKEQIIAVSFNNGALVLDCDRLDKVTLHRLKNLLKEDRYQASYKDNTKLIER